jgi:fucose permease
MSRTTALSGGSLLALAYLGFISLGLPDALLGVGWSSMRAEFGVPVGAVGLLLAVAVTGYLLSSVATGFALAHLGVGWLLAASTGLVAGGLTGYALAPVYAVVVACALLLGLGSGAIDAGLNVYAAENFGARHMNWLHASFGFGAALGPLVMTSVLAAGLAWRWGYGITALAQAILAIAFAVTARKWAGAALQGGAGAAVQGDAGAAVPDRGGAAAGRSGRAALTVPAVWFGAVTFAAYTAIEISAGLWAFTLLTEGRGLSPGVAGTCVSVYWGSLFAGRLLYGVVAERLRPGTVLLWCMAGMATGAVVIAIPAAGWVAVVGLMLIGGFAAPVFPLLTLTTADRVGAEHAGPAVGVQIGAAALGGVACPAAIGLLLDRYGSGVLAPSLVVLAAALVVAYLATLRVAARRAP